MGYHPRENGFYHILQSQLKHMPLFDASHDEVTATLQEEILSLNGLAALLSPAGSELLESIAIRAQGETLRHFGKAIQVFAPLYLANICTNRCIYCGFHAQQKIERQVLTDEEIAKEAEAMARMGLRRVLVLTGDAPRVTGAEYIANAITIVSKHVPSVGIEVQALTEEEYALVCRAGADSMTMFQETYNESLYATLHLAGPKRNFAFRLDAPERAARAGIRGITFGALLGLTDWRRDVFLLAVHANWISKMYPHIDIGISLPRIRPQSEEESSQQDLGYSLDPVSDRDFVQALVALRCFLPHACITMSSRENAFMRDRLISLGVTRVSAGVKTSVGGYAESLTMASDTSSESDPVQFVIDDPRSVNEMAEAIKGEGYQPVFADWILPHDGSLPLHGGIHEALGTGDH